MEYFAVKLRQQLQVGIPARQVREVLSLSADQICPISGGHPLLLGVLNWRGRLLWSLNLSDYLRLKLDPTEASPSASPSALGTDRERLSALVVASPEESAIAGRSLVCLVSQLEGVVEVANAQPVGAALPEPLRSAFCGIANCTAPLLLLDPDRLLDASGWPSIAQPGVF